MYFYRVFFFFKKLFYKEACGRNKDLEVAIIWDLLSNNNRQLVVHLRVNNVAAEAVELQMVAKLPA